AGEAVEAAEQPQVAPAPLRELLLGRERREVDDARGHHSRPPLPGRAARGFAPVRGWCPTDSSVRTFSALPPVPPPRNGCGVHHDHSVHETHCLAQNSPVACQRRIARIRAPCQVARTPPLRTLPSGVT